MGMYFTCPVCAEGRFSDQPHACPGPRVTVRAHPHVNSRELVRSVAEGIGVPVATLAAAIEARGGKIEPEGSPLRSRRWFCGGREIKGHRAGADCSACQRPCVPADLPNEGKPGWYTVWQCQGCGAQAEVCGDSYGLKACELLKGHEGNHESPSGTSWPQKGAPAALHDPLDADLDEVQRRLDEEVARRLAGLPPWSGQSVSPKAANALVERALRPMTFTVHIDASSVEAALDSFKATLAAAAAELRSALADQRTKGASSHEVAKRVEAVADALEGKG